MGVWGVVWCGGWGAGGEGGCLGLAATLQTKTMKLVNNNKFN